MQINNVNLSYFATSLGYWVSLFFIPILILDISQSAMLLSIAYALDILPYIFITPLAGVIGDKFSKKRMILLGEAVCFIAALFLFLIPYEEGYIFIILFLGFMISTFSAIHHPIFQSILPELYDKDQLVKVNADIAMITSLAGIISPAILGILFGLLSNKGIAFFIPLCYLISFFAFFHIQNHHTPQNNKINFYADLKESFLFLTSQSLLMQFSVLFFAINFGLKLIFTGLIWIYSVKFGLDKTWISVNFVFIGIMSILGAKFSGKYLTGKYAEKKIIYLSSVAIGVVIMTLLLFPSAYYLTLAWGTVSFLSMFIVVTYFTFRQKIIPAEQLSRVIALTRLIAYLAIPPSALLAGYLLNHYQNENILYFISGISILLNVFYFLRKR